MLVLYHAPSCVSCTCANHLSDLGGKDGGVPQAELSTSTKGHLADRILCLYVSARPYLCELNTGFSAISERPRLHIGVDIEDVFLRANKEKKVDKSFWRSFAPYGRFR
jgi:hypothetical protein